MYAVILIAVLAGFSSLAVDFGRAQVVKGQLRRAADAAARAAAVDLKLGAAAARTAAISIAAANEADGSPVELLAGDIELGTWDAASKSFIVLPGSSQTLPTAVRITAARTAARGNAVWLIFGKLFGKESCDVSASAIVNTTASSQGYGVVGLNSVTMSGNSLLDSYNAANGPYSAAGAGSNGSVVSNGSITLSGNATIKGNASPGPGQQVVVTGGSTLITGNTNALTEPLSYPSPSAGSYASNNDNSRLGGNWLQPNGDFIVPGNQTANIFSGTYYVRDFHMSANSTFNVKGEATFYVYGNIYMGGRASVNMSRPDNFKIRMLTAGTTATLAGTSDLHADFYAPLSDVTITSNSDLYGAVVGRTLTLAGNGGLHYDESLPNPAANVQGGISLVR